MAASIGRLCLQYESLGLLEFIKCLTAIVVFKWILNINLVEADLMFISSNYGQGYVFGLGCLLLF